MTGRRITTLLCILALLGAFGAAFYYVFEGSFERGEMYPEHSTMRADPRGTMILYETLEQMDGVQSIRWHERISKWQQEDLSHPQDTTLIMLDAYPGDLYEPALENFVIRGGRLIVSPPFSYSRENWREESVDEEEENEEEEPAEIEDTDEEILAVDEIIAPEGSDILYHNERLSVDDDQMLFSNLATKNHSSSLSNTAPTTLIWEADVYLSEDYDATEASPWETLYSVDQMPVIVGRQFGKGKVIVLANGLPLTNESMFAAADYNFLKWLLDNRKTVVFDEYHFGIVKPRGIAMLIREYNLELTLLALFLSFVLFIWHGATPLMSSVDIKLRSGPNRQTVISGYRDLLRRYVDGKNILLVCLDEWKAVFMARQSDQKRFAKQFTEAENIALREMSKPKKERNYKTAYREITNILNQRRLKP